jgi:hypothetical protein
MGGNLPEDPVCFKTEKFPSHPRQPNKIKQMDEAINVLAL